MFELWVILTLISGISSVGFNFISRYVLKDGHDSSAYSWWFEFFRFLIFISFAVFSIGDLLATKNLIHFLAIGLVEFISVYFYMKMHSNSELSISTTIIQLRLVWVPLIALIFLGEKLAAKEYLGIIFIFLGQIITTMKFDMKFTDGVKYAAIASVFVSLNNVVIKSASSILSIPLILVAMALPSIIIFPIKMKDGKKRIINLGRKKWKKIFLATLFNGLTMIFLIQALKFGEVGKVTALFQGVMIFQVLLGVLVLKEKSDLIRKLAGCLAVIVGALLLI